MGENKIFTKLREVPVTKNAALKTRMTKSSPMSSPRGSSKDYEVRTVAMANEHSANIQRIDEQINSLMTKSSSLNKNGLPIYVCNDCGKEGKHSQVRNHIEANHLEGISIPCNFCEKIFSSRNSKAAHMTRQHKGQQDLL